MAGIIYPLTASHVKILILYPCSPGSLAYIGFSLATTQMFALLALRPQMAQTIKPFISLSSCVYYGQPYVPLRNALSAFEPIFRYIIYM